MIKVRILDRCDACYVEAYIFDYQDVDSRGEAYDGIELVKCAMAAIIRQSGLICEN
jgi:hypothetical protein